MSTVVIGMFRSPVVAWAAAAVLACGAFFLWEGKKDVAAKIPALAASEASVREELDRARDMKAALEKQLADATAQSATLTAEVARLKDANAVTSMEVATLRSSLKRYEEGVAVVVWDSQAQQGQLKMEKMPPVQPNKDYQLWVVDKGKSVPVDAGVVKVNPRGSATVTFKPAVPITDVTKFAISVEEAGGVPIGQGPIIMASP
jgi:anti-sigma-K factor RskA